MKLSLYAEKTHFQFDHCAKIKRAYPQSPGPSGTWGLFWCKGPKIKYRNWLFTQKMWISGTKLASQLIPPIYHLGFVDNRKMIWTLGINLPNIP